MKLWLSLSACAVAAALAVGSEEEAKVGARTAEGLEDRAKELLTAGKAASLKDGLAKAQHDLQAKQANLAMLADIKEKLQSPGLKARLASVKDKLPKTHRTERSVEDVGLRGKLLKMGKKLRDKIGGVIGKAKAALKSQKEEPAESTGSAEADLAGAGEEGELSLTEGGDEDEDSQEIAADQAAFEDKANAIDDVLSGRAKRANTLRCEASDGLLWDSVVFYDTEAIQTANQLAAIKCAMDTFNDAFKPQLSFVDKTGQCKQSPYKKNCMYFEDTPKHSPNSCNGHSHVGRAPTQPHSVFFSQCSSVPILCSIMQHELLHALGLDHEQSRADRDAFVSIGWPHIEEDEKHNFDKVPSVAMENYSPYDYDSIMEYGSHDFSKDGRKTIVASDSAANIDDNRALTAWDKRAVKFLYRTGCRPTKCLRRIVNDQGEKDFQEMSEGEAASTEALLFGGQYGDLKLGYVCGRKGFQKGRLDAYPDGIFFQGKFFPSGTPMFWPDYNQFVCGTVTLKDGGAASIGVASAKGKDQC